MHIINMGLFIAVSCTFLVSVLRLQLTFLTKIRTKPLHADEEAPRRSKDGGGMGSMAGVAVNTRSCPLEVAMRIYGVVSCLALTVGGGRPQWQIPTAAVWQRAIDETWCVCVCVCARVCVRVCVAPALSRLF